MGALVQDYYSEAASQRRLATQNNSTAKQLAPAGANCGGKAAAQAAEQVGSSERSVERASFVRRNAPEAFEKVRDGSMSLEQAARVAKAPAETQAKMLAQLDTTEREDNDGDSWGTPPAWLDFARPKPPAGGNGGLLGRRGRRQRDEGPLITR